MVVGTGNAYAPYCYLDEKGELAGYEYEVLKAVDELLPQYEFEYQTSDFANVLISLDAGKIDLAAHQYEYNKERDEKYLFGKEPYTTYVTYLAVAGDRTDIQSLNDLNGRKVKSSTGSNSVYILENYNKDHPDNPIKIDYVNNSTDEETVTGLVNGVWDATILTKRDAEKLNKNYGDGREVIKVTGEPIQSSSTYFFICKRQYQAAGGSGWSGKTIKGKRKACTDIKGCNRRELYGKRVMV
uniref:transporter substrate-binding domain-containing protein n=1 Tax=Clostridium sp. NkU-1 TaxID=1095009 RepID=UPI0006CFA4A7